jgi:hypothetical protein
MGWPRELVSWATPGVYRRPSRTEGPRPGIAAALLVATGDGERREIRRPSTSDPARGAAHLSRLRPSAFGIRHSNAACSDRTQYLLGNPPRAHAATQPCRDGRMHHTVVSDASFLQLTESLPGRRLAGVRQTGGLGAGGQAPMRHNIGPLAPKSAPCGLGTLGTRYPTGQSGDCSRPKRATCH